ncbi:hypothetical protein PC122_g20337 [Phytophthora cactorum]|nr:hypothetical protein PC122_g20337 [Phytophthora cactorum]
MPQQDDTNAAARQPRKKRKTTESQDGGTSVIFKVAQEGDAATVASSQLDAAVAASSQLDQLYRADYAGGGDGAVNVGRAFEKEQFNSYFVRQSKAPPIPEEWGFYAKTFECTHAGKYAPRGEGQRPHQNVRPLGCKAQINLCYPTTRLAIRDDVMTSVDILQRSGVKKKKTILKYIREHSDCKPVIRDVHNLVASLKAREIGTATVAERLHKWMVEQQRILKCSKSS